MQRRKTDRNKVYLSFSPGPDVFRIKPDFYLMSHILGLEKLLPTQQL